jgi:phage tail-like protein
MPTRIDPYLSRNFRVEIDNIPAAAFSEVLGLEATIDVVEYRTGTDAPDSVRKLPGLTKYPNITLKRGFTQDLSLWTWMHNNITGDLDRRNVGIILLDQAGNEVIRWTLSNAWPCKWTGPKLHAECSEVAIETLELCYESLGVSADS